MKTTQKVIQIPVFFNVSFFHIKMRFLTVAELLIMMKKDAEVVEELRILKEETKVLEQRRNEAMDRKINQRNAFILQLLEEKRQFEEKMKKV